MNTRLLRWLVAPALALLAASTVMVSADPGPIVLAPQAAQAPGCCEPVMKVCVPTAETKKIAHTCYGCKEVDYCLPKCTLFGFLSKKGCCDDTCGSDCNDCGHPRVKRQLVKRIVIEERCVTKCKVEIAPCAPACTPVCTPACKPACTPACAPACTPAPVYVQPVQPVQPKLMPKS